MLSFISSPSKFKSLSTYQFDCFNNTFKYTASKIHANSTFIYGVFDH